MGCSPCALMVEVTWRRDGRCNRVVGGAYEVGNHDDFLGSCLVGLRDHEDEDVVGVNILSVGSGT